MRKFIAMLAGAFILTTIAACSTMLLSDNPGHYRNSTVLVEDGEGHASGVLVAKDIVLTAAHVVGTEKHENITFGGSDKVVGDVVFKNVDYDVALIKVKAPEYAEVVSIDCGPVTWGQHVTVVGFPLEGRWLETQGTVASIDKSHSVNDPIIDKFMPLDVVINLGNSGGPVFNDEGKIIGLANAFMNSMVPPYGGQSGLGLMSAAVNWCKFIMPELNK